MCDQLIFLIKTIRYIHMIRVYIFINVQYSKGRIKLLASVFDLVPPTL